MKKFVLITLLFSFTYCLRSQCVDPSLIDPAAICIALLDPVCGCDGVTYDNSCWAEVVGGVTSWTAGSCTSNNCLSNNNQPGNIPTGVYGSTMLTHSNGLVDASSIVVLESETAIDLEPNFQTIIGADFTAHINPCNNFDFTIGDASNGMNLSETFYLHYGGGFYFWFEGNAPMCPSSAVEIDIVANGISLYYNIVEVADLAQMPTPGFMITLNAPPMTPITINANLVQTNNVPNQGISCFVLGDATFGFSY